MKSKTCNDTSTQVFGELIVLLRQLACNRAGQVKIRVVTNPVSRVCPSELAQRLAFASMAECFRGLEELLDCRCALCAMTDGQAWNQLKASKPGTSKKSSRDHPTHRPWSKPINKPTLGPAKGHKYDLLWAVWSPCTRGKRLVQPWVKPSQSSFSTP